MHKKILFTIIVIVSSCMVSFSQSESAVKLLADSKEVNLEKGISVSRLPSHFFIKFSGEPADSVKTIEITVARGVRPIKSQKFNSQADFDTMNAKQWLTTKTEGSEDWTIVRAGDRIVFEIEGFQTKKILMLQIVQ